MNGMVHTRNLREYAPKGQVPEFIYERNDSLEKITGRLDLYFVFPQL